MSQECERKVAIFSPFFYPEKISTGKYNGIVAEALAQQGNDVLVVCSHPLYPAWKPERCEEVFANIKTYRGGLGVSYPSHPLLRRAVLELWFAWHSFLALLTRTRGVDTIVAVFPPSLFMLLFPLMVPSRVKVVGIVHDLQGVYAAKKSGLVGRLLQGAIAFVERRAFLACDQLIFLSEAMRSQTIAAYGLNKASTSVQYPFVTLPDQGVALRKRLESKFKGGQKTIVYSGALGEKQAPEKLIRLLKHIVERDVNWRAQIYSEGPIFRRLKEEVIHPSISFHDLVPVEDLPELLARSDIQIVPQEVGTSGGSLPSKLPNIVAANTKLLCITDPGSELQELVQAYSRGVVCTSWNIEECMKAFCELADLEAVDNAKDKIMLSKFTLEGLTQCLIQREA